jgi:hypothetical protein
VAEYVIRSYDVALIMEQLIWAPAKPETSVMRSRSGLGIADVFEADFWPGALRICVRGRNFRF